MRLNKLSSCGTIEKRCPRPMSGELNPEYRLSPTPSPSCKRTLLLETGFSRAKHRRRFVPVSLISSIYGMNVSQITSQSSNPSIWQFFVATILLNVVILLSLALSTWLQIIFRQKRRAGLREVMEFALGIERGLNKRLNDSWGDNSDSVQLMSMNRLKRARK
jgi:uncharacterized protein (DUF983 family)